MTFNEEQKALYLSYLENHVFQYWRNPDKTNRIELELIVSPVCNTKCTYCYYKNFDQYLYPKEIRNQNQIIENCEKLLKWVQKEGFAPSIEIFSGEFLQLPYYKKILDLLSTYLPKDKETFVCIPTNATFCQLNQRCR